MFFVDRLEAELEEKRLREREEMMAELQAMKEAAQREMDRQRTDYEDRITQLASDMVSERERGGGRGGGGISCSHRLICLLCVEPLVY